MGRARESKWMTITLSGFTFGVLETGAPETHLEYETLEIAA